MLLRYSVASPFHHQADVLVPWSFSSNIFLQFLQACAVVFFLFYRTVACFIMYFALIQSTDEAVSFNNNFHFSLRFVFSFVDRIFSFLTSIVDCCLRFCPKRYLCCTLRVRKVLPNFKLKHRADIMSLK